MELNGKPASAADIAPLALYNYGNFTTMLVERTGTRGLGLHLDRLDHDARVLFGTGIDKPMVKEWMWQVVKKWRGDVVVRVTIFSKAMDFGHPNEPSALDVLITKRPAPEKPASAISLKPVEFQRALPELKTVNIGAALYQRRVAQMAGFDDALFVQNDQAISEGPTWNIGFTKANQVILSKGPSLPGVSVALLQKALEEQGISVHKQVIHLSDLNTLDSAFIINATTGIRTVKAIGEHTFTAHQNLAMLRELYEAIPHEQF